MFFFHVSVMSAFSYLIFSQDFLLISFTLVLHPFSHYKYFTYIKKVLFFYIHLGFHTVFHMVYFSQED